MRDYELMLIIKPDVTDEDATAVIDKVKAYVTEHKGEVAEVKPWGKKKLAYPIGQFKEGNYVLTRLKLEATQTRELETNLKISEKVLRHLLVKVE